MSAPGCAVDSIVQNLRSRPSEEAWADFLLHYSALILETCQHSCSDQDQAADSFLYTCEQLRRNNFRRLVKFDPQGSASFSTWLRVVVRNLCLDWLRKRFGRPRLFRSIARLSQLDGEVYRCRYEQGLSLGDTYTSLRQSFPGLTMEQLAAGEERVQQSITCRQLRLMDARKARLRIDGRPSGVEVIDEATSEPADPRPTPESILADREREGQLWRAVGKLPKLERLVIRMRFGQGLTLEEIGRLTGLGDAQRVHRRIGDVLEKLRAELV
jgi:RNA polymerase sigma factor (sigma-70 family)